jgi:hypothetical protein
VFFKKYPVKNLRKKSKKHYCCRVKIKMNSKGEKIISPDITNIYFAINVPSILLLYSCLKEKPGIIIEKI